MLKLRAKIWLPLLLMLFCNYAFASDDYETARELSETGEILPLETILNKARQYHNGKVIGVELERENTTLIYEIKVLDDDGILWEMKINAKDGKLLEEEED